MNEQQNQTAPSIVFPSQSLLNGYQYTPAAGTNVQDTWRKFGWTPTTDEERAQRNKEKQQ